MKEYYWLSVPIKMLKHLELNIYFSLDHFGLGFEISKLLNHSNYRFQFTLDIAFLSIWINICKK